MLKLLKGFLVEFIQETFEDGTVILDGWSFYIYVIFLSFFFWLSFVDKIAKMFFRLYFSCRILFTIGLFLYRVSQSKSILLLIVEWIYDCIFRRWRVLFVYVFSKVVNISYKKHMSNLIFFCQIYKFSSLNSYRQSGQFYYLCIHCLKHLQCNKWPHTVRHTFSF